MDAAVFFLSCHLQLLLFANIFVARRRTANIRAERRQRRALLMRSRQQRLRAYQEGCGRRRFQFMSAMLMLRPQPTTRRFWTFLRMNDLWQDAQFHADFRLLISAERTRSITHAHSRVHCERSRAAGGAFTRRSRTDAKWTRDRDRFRSHREVVARNRNDWNDWNVSEHGQPDPYRSRSGRKCVV